MNTRRVSRRSHALLGGASLAVLAALMTAAPTAALAQEDPASSNLDPSSEADEDATELEEIIVTGARRALQTSQNIKRDADTVVETITATDIGAFPDKSIAEALQRVAGITVNRFSASDDTSHFASEPSGVLVRGLQQVRSEYNGRDTFSANSSRGLSYADISPELMQGVDTYKNQTAEMIEGGIAGTINLRTRVPFDATDRLMQISGAINYGDITQKYTPDVSGIFSDRWDTEIGEIGFLANLAYSDVTTTSQVIQYGRMGVFQDVYGPGAQYIPSSVGFRNTEYDRERNGVAVAGQWRSPDETLLLTAQYNRSDFQNEWRERGVISYNADMFSLPTDFVYTSGGPRNVWIPRPAMGTGDFVFDEEGVFESGTLVIGQTDTGWWGASDAEAANIAVNDQGVNMLNPCYAWQGDCADPFKAGDLNAVTRFNETHNLTEDAAVNLRWQVTDRLRASFDAQFINSEVENYDVEIGTYTFANLQLDASGDLPRMTFLAPTNINQSAGGLTNPNNYRYNHAMDHREDSEGQEIALRADAEYAFDTTWLNSLKVGVRYADRDQTVRYSTYNWGNISNNWNLGNGQARYWNIDSQANNGFNGYPPGLYENVQFGGDFFGGTNEFVFFSLDRAVDHAADLLSVDRLGIGQDNWRPICERPGEVEGSCFRPAELNDVQETTRAAYAMLRFGGPDALWGNIGVSGNIGVRYIESEDESTGSLSFPDPYSPETLVCRDVPTTPEIPNPPIPRTIGCYLSAEDIAFANGGGITSTAESSHEHWLPSFNLKLDLTEEVVLRFAASRALSRPDIGLLKNFVDISGSLPGADPNDERYVKNAAGVITGVNPYYTANAYNPYLEPTTADMFDVSLEYYFADVGSFTVAAFYKKFHDYIQYGAYDLDVTNNGVTRTVQVRGPVNGDGAEIRGFEVAFQRFFDFLPAPFDGFGVQTNYTYIQNEGITNTNLKVASGGSSETAQPGSAGTVLQVDALEGLSEHAFNLVGMYEKGPWAARLAYNWRSEFLVTAVDCCVYLPIWQEDAGFLDGSIRYALSDNLEIRFEASNILNTTTKLRQQVTDSDAGGVLTPNAWVQADRRFVLGVRFRY